MKLEKNTVEEAAGRALFREAESAHYYTPKGVPAYTRTIKSGPNQGKERATSLADARKENLFPSITTIGKVKREPMIDKYREKHLLKASYENRPKKAEAPDDYFDRILSKARFDSMEAARLGSGYHDSFEAILLGEKWNKRDSKLKIVADWVQTNVEEVIWTEKILVDEGIGVAGKADALVRLKEYGPTLVDWKTRRFKEYKTEPKWRATWYKSDCRQLAFYGRCIERDLISRDFGDLREEREAYEISVCNVGMNTKATSQLHVKWWSRDEREWALECVEAMNSLWQHENGYRPKGVGIPNSHAFPLGSCENEVDLRISSELLRNAQDGDKSEPAPLDRLRLINTRKASELFSAGLTATPPKGENWDALVTYFDGRTEYFELGEPTKEKAVNQLARRNIV